MMKKRIISGVLAGVLSVGMAATTIPAVNVLADDMGWVEEDGVKYWYENGVKQGTEGRGKEIYDPGSGAWYWLDAVDGGKMAVSKDVYQDSLAGQWGDREDENGVKYGKWVRYDENGHMVKGWNEKDGNKYYFDLDCGTMAKGDADIDGVHYYFNKDTGILESGGTTDAATDDDGRDFSEDGWHKVDGVNYWYEGGVRQGYDANNPDYRGKEIYDASSDAWYWLDNVQQGAVAKDKDVYQESEADDAGTIGKWVRYDADGHMVKGWSEKDGNKYYFDPTYGTMAKGIVNIDGTNYEFDKDTGVLLREVTEKISYNWCNVGSETYTVDGKLSTKNETEFNNYGRVVKSTTISGKSYDSDKKIRYAEDENDTYVSYEYEYKYDDAGNITQRLYASYTNSSNGVYLYYNEVENYENGSLKDDTYTYYNADGSLYHKSVNTYENGKSVRYYDYKADGSVNYYYLYDYEGDNLVKRSYYNDNNELVSTLEYIYDDNGKKVKEETHNADGELTDYTEYVYTDGNMTESIEYSLEYSPEGEEFVKSYRTTYEYDGNGNKTVETRYKFNSDGTERIYSRYTYSYEDYNGRYTNTKSYDSETSHWNSDNQEYELGYSYGYEYVREDGVLVKYINYTSDDSYNKVMSYYEVYNSYSLPSPEDGLTYFVDHYRTRYDANDNVVSYTNYNYKCIAVKSYK